MFRNSASTPQKQPAANVAFSKIISSRPRRPPCPDGIALAIVRPQPPWLPIPAQHPAARVSQARSFGNSTSSEAASRGCPFGQRGYDYVLVVWRGRHCRRGLARPASALRPPAAKLPSDAPAHGGPSNSPQAGCMPTRTATAKARPLMRAPAGKVGAALKLRARALDDRGQAAERSVDTILFDGVGRPCVDVHAGRAGDHVVSGAGLRNPLA